MQKSFVLLCFLLLSACGFHPRGATVLSPPLQSVYIKADNPYGQLAKNLKRSFMLSHVELADSPSTARTVLAILRTTESQQQISMSSTQLTRQYNLILSVTFQITNSAGKVLVLPQTLSESRSLTIQEDQILAGSNEATTLYQQMYQAIVFDIMNRLSSMEIADQLKRANA